MNTDTSSSIQPIHISLNEASDGTVGYRRNYRALIAALVLLITGILLIVVADRMIDPTTALFMASMVFGIAGIIAGIIVFLYSRKQLVYIPTNSPIRKELFYFDPENLSKINRQFEQGDFSSLEKLERRDNSSLRVDLYASRDGQFTAVRIYRYVPYAFEAVSPIYCTSQKKSTEMVSSLAK